MYKISRQSKNTIARASIFDSLQQAFWICGLLGGSQVMVDHFLAKLDLYTQLSTPVTILEKISSTSST